MKSIISTWIMLLAICCGCSEHQTKHNLLLTFQKEQAIPFNQSNISKNKKEITLEFSDNSLLSGYPSMLMCDDNFIVFNKNKAQTILRFDYNGKLINRIGNIGNGSEEYITSYDVFVDNEQKEVEVLNENSILKYTVQGEFIDKINCPIPAFSFISTNNSYWFYTGNNKAFGSYKVLQTDHLISNNKAFLKSESNMLPIIESNFGQSSYSTFFESFNNQLYKIENDSIKETYRIDFLNLEIPTSLHTMAPLEALPQLQKHKYATIKKYLENDEYIYLLVAENKENEDHLFFYYWIINKQKKTETIIEIEDVLADSYLLSPQLLTRDNLLYLIGYPTEHKGEMSNPNHNPSIFIINLSEIQKYNL